MLFIRRRSLTPLLAALVGGSLSASTRTDVLWQVAERQYQYRLKKLDDPAWVGEVSPARRFMSLVLIGVGVVVFEAAVSMLAIIVGGAEAPSALMTPGLLLLLVMLTIAVVLFWIAKELRRPRKLKDR